MTDIMHEKWKATRYLLEFWKLRELADRINEQALRREAEVFRVFARVYRRMEVA